MLSFCNLKDKSKTLQPIFCLLFAVFTGSGQPVNGTIPSLPSPTMPTFNVAAQTPNGQPAGTEAVYTNGIPQGYPGRKYNYRKMPI